MVTQIIKRHKMPLAKAVLKIIIVALPKKLVPVRKHHAVGLDEQESFPQTTDVHCCQIGQPGSDNCCQLGKKFFFQRIFQAEHWSLQIIWLQFPSKTVAREIICIQRTTSRRTIPQCPMPMLWNTLKPGVETMNYGNWQWWYKCWWSTWVKNRSKNYFKSMSPERQGQELPQAILHWTESLL